MKKTVYKWICLVVIFLCISVSAMAYANFKSNYNTKSFANDLCGLGYSATRTGPTDGDIVSFKTLIYAEDQLIEVIEYKDNSALKKKVALIKEVASGNPNLQVQWPPFTHIYKRGKIVVTYSGNNDKLISELQTILGKPLIIK